MRKREGEKAMRICERCKSLCKEKGKKAAHM